MAQDQINISSGGGEGDDESNEAQAGQVNISTTGNDDLLDEIDSLLDNNAEEFVRSYVQKGGQ